MLSVFNSAYGFPVVLKLICLTLTGMNWSFEFYNKVSMNILISKLNSD